MSREINRWTCSLRSRLLAPALSDLGPTIVEQPAHETLPAFWPSSITGLTSGPGRDRTCDQGIMSPLL